MTEDNVVNPFAIFENQADPSVPSATLQIYSFINEFFKRSESTEINRASAATMCYKRRWYQKNNTPALPITPRKIINFALGDLSEALILWAIKNACVGEGKLYSEVNFGEPIGKLKTQGKEIEYYSQIERSANVGPYQVISHADGMGKRNSDGCWEVIECKSAANYGFKSFQTDGPDDYLKQGHVVMRANDVSSIRYFYIRKETGHLWDRAENFNPELWKTIENEFALANGVGLPSTPYPLIDELKSERKGNVWTKKKTGRKTACWQCQYCPYINECHGKPNIEWKADQWGNQKPNFVFKEKETNNELH